VSEDAELRRLRWRSRRGMRELDRLFEAFLDRRWLQAEPAARGRFERLLDCEDDQLWRWFLGHQRPHDPELETAVREVLDAAGD